MSFHRVNAPGKLMIAGEYAVLFGYSAIVVAVDKRAQCHFSSGESLDLRSNIQDHALFDSCFLACRQLGIEPLVGQYVLDTSSFFNGDRKLGLGSSAAAIVALCKQIMTQRGLFDTEVLLRVSQRAHRIFSHRSGSGADIAASVCGGIISYQNLDREPRIDRVPDRALFDELLFIDTKRPQKTSSFVAQVMAFARENKKVMDRLCQRSEDIVDRLLALKNDQDSCMGLMEESFHLLKDLGQKASVDIVSQEHREIHALAYDCGGSAKPSGAGGGDIALALIPKARRANFRSSMVRLGYDILPLHLCGEQGSSHPSHVPLT